MKYQDRLINRLFYVLKQKYGSLWVSAIGDVEQSKSDWNKALSSVNPKKIALALDKVKEVYPHNPPTATEFAKLVREVSKSRPGHLSFRLWEYQPPQKASLEVARTELKKMRENRWI